MSRFRVWHDLPVTLAKVIALLLSCATTDSGLVRGMVCGSRDVAINSALVKTIGELKVRHAAASVGREVFGSGMSLGFCTLAGRQGEGRKSRIAEQLSELRNKKTKGLHEEFHASP